MEWSRGAANDRRRMQNRLAQRRFRWRQTQNREKTDPANSNPNPGPALRVSASGHTASPRVVQDQEPGPPLFPASPGAPDPSETEHLDQPRIVGQSGTSASNLSGEFVLSNFAMGNFYIPLPTESEFAHTWLPGDNNGIEGLGSPLLPQPEQIGLEGSESSIGSTLLQGLTPDSSSSISTGENMPLAPTRTSLQIFPPTPESASTASPSHQAPPPNGYMSAAARVQMVPDSKTSWFNPLHSAAARGHARIVRVLLEYQLGQSDHCNACDSDGLTPLAHAIAGGFEDVVASLLSHGAHLTDVAPGSNGKLSALHWAVLKRRERCLQMLLERKDNNADHTLNFVNTVDGVGRSPLHLAVQIDFEAGVLLLLKHGADLNSRAPKT